LLITIDMVTGFQLIMVLTFRSFFPLKGVMEMQSPCTYKSYPRVLTVRVGTIIIYSKVQEETNHVKCIDKMAGLLGSYIADYKIILCAHRS